MGSEINAMQASVSGWQVHADDRGWDAALASLQGHPLQSRLWGDARRRVESIDYLALACKDVSGRVLALARVEIRPAALLGTVAWIPKGPVYSLGATLPSGLEDRLRESGFCMWASSPYREMPAVPSSVALPKTIWLDLSKGREALWGDLDAQWRYGVGRAQREGVVVRETSTPEQVHRFHALCLAISARKGFELPGSEALMLQLLRDSQAEAPVEARLFIAMQEGAIVGGIFIMRAGKHLHYLWGAVDRAHARARAGEALQWAVIEWGLAQGCTRYDLEGIDPVNNPGTYQFKKKMGGTQIQLQQQLERPLDWRGSVVLQALRVKRRLERGAAPRPAGMA